MLSEARLPDRRTADDEETHMVTDALAPATVTTRTWRVTTDSVDAAPTLRDYLRRLGTSAELRGPGAVEFETDEPEHEIDGWVGAWVTRNGIVVQLDPVELLGIVLLREQMIFEDELARTLSQQLSIPYIGIMQIGVNPHVARLLPADVGEAAAAIPVRASEQSVQVVFADPTDPQAYAAVCEHLPHIDVAVAELSDIRLAWRTIAQAELRSRFT
jgi:hypothetical protein